MAKREKILVLDYHELIKGKWESLDLIPSRKRLWENLTILFDSVWIGTKETPEMLYKPIPSLEQLRQRIIQAGGSDLFLVGRRRTARDKPERIFIRIRKRYMYYKNSADKLRS